MIIMMHLTRRPAITMARFTLPRPLQIIGWLATGTMAAIVVTMVGSWLN